MTTPDPVQVAYDVLEDAMTPNRDDPAGHWLSELPPDLLAQRIAAAYGMAGLLLPPGGKTRDALEAAITRTDTTT